MGLASKRSLLLRGITVLLGLALCAYAVSDQPFYGGEPGFGGFQKLILGLGLLLAGSAFLPRAWNGRVLLVYVVGFFSLGIAELGAEIVLSPMHRSCYQVDERLVFSLRPDCRSVYRRSPANGGESIYHSINGQGFRGEEIRTEKSAPRIIVYGDSFIHAAYSADEETLAAQLETMLSERLGREVEVINGGVSSFGPDQLSLKMEDDLPRLQPDLLVLAIFAGNDYGDLLRNKLFRLGEDGSAVPNDWSLDPEVRRSFELSQQESVLKRAIRSAVNRLRAPSNPYAALGLDTDEGADPDAALIDFWLDNAEQEYTGFVIQNDDVVTNTHMDHYSADVSLQPGSESAQYKVALMRAVLSRVKATTDAAGVPLLVLPIPHPMDACESYGVGRVDPERFPEYERRNLISPIESWTEDEEVRLVRLYDEYVSRGACELYYRAGNDHWNAEGQRVAAEMITELVLEDELLSSEAK